MLFTIAPSLLLVIFVSLSASLMRENLRELRENLDHKICATSNAVPPNTRKDSKNNLEKDLILKCAQRKKIKKIEEEQDTDDEGNFTNNHGPVTGKV